MSNATQTLLTASLERKLRQEQLGDQIANRNYEGEITGPEDTVKILVAQAGTVQNYTGGSISIEENVDGTPAPMNMDHKRAFAFLMDASANIARYAEQFAGETFAEVLEQADKRILSEASDAGNSFTWTDGTDSIDDLFGQARQDLDDAGAPQAQRFAVVNPSVARQVYNDLQGRESERGDEALMSGQIGMYYGFMTYTRPDSFFPLSTPDSNPIAMFGSRFYLTYGDAVVQIQVIEDAPGYPASTVIQGLHVAGAKVTQPDSMVGVEIA